ncbi:hypothetical protein J6P92_10040 [bacterium]|nr:hypothetical protein [bacterium]
MNETENISSQADNQNSLSEQQEQIKMLAVREIKKIENYVQTGQLTQDQGLNLMKFVTEKAFEKCSKISQLPEEQTTLQNVSQKTKETPDFFKKDGRIDVFNYLMDSDTNFDDDEISKISSIVEKIENSAIERFLKAKEHEKTLKNENESAKQRLRANAQNSSYDGTTNLVYTREQIGRMSGAEFAKHERAIMDQLRKGLIK